MTSGMGDSWLWNLIHLALGLNNLDLFELKIFIKADIIYRFFVMMSLRANLCELIIVELLLVYFDALIGVFLFIIL